MSDPDDPDDLDAPDDPDARDEADAGQPPRTGDRDIDVALEQVRQLEELPVADHHDVLSPVHDQLQQALRRDHSTPTGER